jgi:hypothetical protein
MRNMRTVKFGRWDCEVVQAKYAEGERVALLLRDVKTRESIVTATVNEPDFPLSDDEVLIKNWSENAGIVEALVGAEIVEVVGEGPRCGFVRAVKCRLLVNDLAEA